MVLRQLKAKLNNNNNNNKPSHPFLKLHTKISTKYIKGISVRANIFKLLDKNIDKNSLQAGRICLQITYLMNTLYSKQLKNTYNSIRHTSATRKWTEGLSRHFTIGIQVVDVYKWKGVSYHSLVKKPHLPLCNW